MHIVCFQGGFANQLFQYCLYLQLKEKFSEEIVLADISRYKKVNAHGGYKLGKLTNIEINKDESIIARCEMITEQNYENVQHVADKNYYYYGYWQHEKYFPYDLEPLRRIFDNIILTDSNKNVLERIEKSESVSIHVRRGDYVNNYLHGNIANKSFYQNAIDEIRKRINSPNFFVFSDDIDWCRANLSFGDSEVYFVTGNDNAVHVDVMLMSKCKNNIISNSSFSWWAQRLNKNSNKLVVFPEYWFNENHDGIEVTECESIKIKNVPLYETYTQEPFFSILVPVYNKECCLKRCMASVLNQSFKDIEVIVVDDGSTDDSLEVLKEYARYDSRVSIISHEKNKSLLSARITAMKNAKGRYILFVDSDDYIEENACDQLYSFINENKCDIVEYKYLIQPGKKPGKEYPVPKDYVEASLMYRYSHTIWDKCYSNRVINDSLGDIEDFYCNMSEDSYFTSIFFYYAKDIRHMDKVLYYYVDLGGMTADSNMSLDSLKRNCDSIDEKSNHLKAFFEKKRPEMKECVDFSANKQIEFMRTLSMRDSVPVNVQIELLEYMDSRYGTSYATQYEKRIKKLITTQRVYDAMGRKQKLKCLLKKIIKEVLLLKK